jgi:hypothetical protein
MRALICESDAPALVAKLEGRGRGGVRSLRRSRARSKRRTGSDRPCFRRNSSAPLVWPPPDHQRASSTRLTARNSPVAVNGFSRNAASRVNTPWRTTASSV